MGTKTFGRLLLLLVVVGLLGGGAALTWQRQVQRMARDVVTRADQAAEREDWAKAAELYGQHLKVVPGDVEVELKYNEAMIKADPSAKRLGEALGRFEGILNQYPSRDDVRRRAAEVAVEVGAIDKASHHLDTLLKHAADGARLEVGHLEYLMARCRELEGELAGAKGAVAGYQSAIKDGAPEQIEASQKLAMLLRGPMQQRDAADQVIDAMVKSAPGDYKAYLGRGRYREGLGDIAGATADFDEALRLAPGRPEVYLEVARSVERDKGIDAAREVLEKGLKAQPKSVELYLTLSNLEARSGAGRDGRAAADRAAATIDRGLKALPERLDLRVQLALLLAERGRTGELLIHIDQLERQGMSQLVTQYIKAYYHVNKREFSQARQILASLQADVAANPALKAKVNILLARCLAELGEPEMAADATLRGFSSNPGDVAARLGWIQELVRRGAIDEAILQYRELQKDQPGPVRLPLAALLIEQNLRLPESRRRWGEAEALIADAEAAAPQSAEPALLRVELLRAQGDPAGAVTELEKARVRFPKDARPWLNQARLLIDQRKFDEAGGLLDRAGKEFGDTVDLRLVRVELADRRGGPQAARALEGLAGGLDGFTPEDRRRLLTRLADVLLRHQDLPAAARAWSRLAEDEPESLAPRLGLFDLAIMAGDDKQAEARIRDVEKLDASFGRFCRAQYLTWKARTASNSEDKERVRAEARAVLDELKVGRPDWSRVPLALARLDREEFAEAKDDAARRARGEAAINAYRRAMELGQRNPMVVRELVQLLFEAKRGGEALEIYSQVPAAGQLPGGLDLMVSQAALSRRNFAQAEESARKAVEANPGDYPARVWLARVLIEDRKLDEAEAVLRDAIAKDQADPDRWANLVVFLVQNRRMDRAAQAVDDAGAHIGAKAPLAMAQCCEKVGKAYTAGDPEQARWYGQARAWLDAAQKAPRDHADLSVKGRLAEFFLRTGQVAAAEGPLEEILARTADGKSPDLAAGARRLLAEVYALGDPPRIADALALIAARAGQPGGDPADLRILARIHQAQGAPDGYLKAIEDLKTLVARDAAAPDDRRRLAELLDSVGQWDQAREQYRELIHRTEDARDIETLVRRPVFITQFFDAIIRRHRPGDDLAEARGLVEKFRPFQRNPMTMLVMEAQLDKADGQPGQAAERFGRFADRTDLTTTGRLMVAQQAEQIGLFDVAEAIYRRASTEPAADPRAMPNWAYLANYLSRRGRIKDAIDVCQGRWNDAGQRLQAANVCIGILASPDAPHDKEQIRRVIGWFEQARSQQPQAYLSTWLGNLYERLGEYPTAEERYREAIKLGDKAGIAANNLAWLITLRRDGRGTEALDLINGAIRSHADPEYFDTLGMVRLLVGQQQAAVADLEKSLKAAPTPSKYFHLAEAYLANKDTERARLAFETGKTRGLPSGLHTLEQPAYKDLTSKLGKP